MLPWLRSTRLFGGYTGGIIYLHHMYIHWYIHTYLHWYIYIFTLIDIVVYIYTSMYMSIYCYMDIYNIYIYICIFILICIYTYNLPGARPKDVDFWRSISQNPNDPKSRPKLQPRQGSFWVPGIYRIDYMPLQRSPGSNCPTPINHLWGWR